MKKVFFAIALHLHQPTGNFTNVFERAYNLCYRPLLEFLSKRPNLKIMLHISGCLLDYLDEKHPDIIQLVKNMISRNQIEIMGGAYYEPILTAIPERDIMSQIKMMSDYIKHRFNTVPKGMWIAERVWGPSVAKVLCKAGIHYLILDDEHILRSGIKKNNVHGYFLTGSGKEKIAVFPSNKNLRYMIPFRAPQETLDYFKSASRGRQNILFTYGDDGEKFGEWPGTHTLVFENQWLHKFVDMLQKNKDWIRLVHFSDYLKNNKPQATLAIKQGSYGEMMEWSGGSWLNFISKYQETNQMHKKMMYVSSKVKKIDKLSKQRETKKIAEARKELYEGQCNCAYWHGVFGGLYLYHLRHAVYKHLIESEKITDALIHKDRKNWLDIKNLDFYMNGKNAIFVENNDFSICIDPYEGGVIKELDYRPLSFNLVNTISRKEEAYHKKILNAAQHQNDSKIATIHDDFRSVDPAFKKMLVYDRYGRYFSRSYFVRKDLRLEDFAASSYEELGNFSMGAYTYERSDKGVILKRESIVSNAELKVEKKIQVKSKNGVEITCSVNRKGAAGIDALFGIEFNITMPDLNSDRYHYYYEGKAQGDLNAQGNSAPLSSFGISDSSKEFSISFHFSKKPVRVLFFPVKTISQSERAYELNYQCSCIYPVWDLELEKKSMCSFNINVVFGT